MDENQDLLLITAGLPSWTVAPVVVLALWAFCAREAQILQRCDWVELLGVRSELRPGESFDFLKED